MMEMYSLMRKKVSVYIHCSLVYSGYVESVPASSGYACHN